MACEDLVFQAKDDPSATHSKHDSWNVPMGEHRPESRSDSFSNLRPLLRPNPIQSCSKIRSLNRREELFRFPRKCGFRPSFFRCSGHRLRLLTGDGHSVRRSDLMRHAFNYSKAFGIPAAERSPVPKRISG